MKNLLIKSIMLSMLLLVGFAMATNPPVKKEKAKTEVSCSQQASTATAHATTPANLPSWCNPADCNPANCKPADCKPSDCKITNCMKPSTACQSKGQEQ